jgi:DNA ligase (NAD+)
MAEKRSSIPRAARARVKALRAEIERHNRLYYIEARPEIPDSAYDALFRELQELEARHPELAAADSPTRRVGASAVVSGTGRFGKKKAAPLPAAAPRAVREVLHAIPLLSLDNTYAPDELRAFDERVRKAVAAPLYVVEPKVDGVAVAITYRDGGLVLAATRGDGVTGEDVTANILTIRELPRMLRNTRGLPDELHLRGEVYIAKKRFAEIVEEMTEAGEEPFANPRNTAAGTLKLLDTTEVARRGLQVFIHSVAVLESESGHMEMMKRLEKAGVPVIPFRRPCGGIDELLGDLEKLDRDRRAYPFETDGLVIKVDSGRDRAELGEKSRSPRWAIAYKFAPEVAESRLLAIELQVGRTGVVTPVARFEPVPLSGTTVSSASLHNEDEIRRLDLRVGDGVKVQKAGEIIPQVIGVIPAARRSAEFEMPSLCPVCGSPLRRGEKKVKWLCTGAACPATVRARILHFGGRRAMEIDGLGDSTVDALIEAGLVKEIADLYDLNAEAVEALPRMAEKSAANLVAAIAKSREQPMHRLIFALGIPGVGEATARDLAESIGSMRAVAEASEERLEEVREIGETLAASIHAWLALPASRRLLERLEAAGLRAFRETARPSAPVDGPLAGKKIVVTGSVPGLDRRAAEEAVRRLGGLPQSSVSRQTDLLVLGDSPGSKYNKALEFGIDVLPADQFAAMVAKAAGGR